MTILEECFHFTLTKEVLDFVPIPLRFNKIVYLVQGSLNHISNKLYTSRKGKLLCEFPDVFQD